MALGRLQSRHFMAALGWLAVAGLVQAQEKQPRIDVQRYMVEADINPRTQSLTATARISFTPREDTSAAVFELNSALTTTKIVDSAGKTLASGRDPQNSSIRIEFASALVKDKPSEVAITYNGKLTGEEDGPISGIKFAALHQDFGYLLYPSRWFPVAGYTVDRYAATFKITTPSEYSVVGSGDLKTERLGGNKTAYVFEYTKESFPGSIAITKDKPVTASSQGVGSEIYFRSRQNVAQNYGDESGKIMSFLTAEFGLAPQAKVTLVETEAGSINGYSAPGIVFLTPNTIGTQVNTRVLTNQLARQWWGVLVSPTTRNHLWMTNGAARFAEMLYTEHLSGAAAYENDMRTTYVEALTVSDPPVLQAARLEDYSPEYWALTSAKGAAIMNMLRATIGDDLLKKTYKAFIDKYSYQSVSSEDFRKVVEQVSGQDLRYFFLQWLESSGAPEFKMSYTVFRTTKGFRIVGKIEQDLDTFRMPVDLKIETEGNPESKRVEVTGISSEFSVDTFGKPRVVVVDPQHQLLRIDTPTRVAIAIRRGEQFVEINDYANALREYQKAIEVSRNSSLAHYRIAELFFKQNNFQSAANEFRAALNGDIEPKWTEVWSHINLGKIFDVTGQRDRAVNEYKQAIRTRDNTAGAQTEAAKFSTKAYERANSES